MKNKNVKPLYEVIAKILAPISPQNPSGYVPYKTKEKVQYYMGKIIKNIIGIDYYTGLEHIIRKNAKNPDMQEILSNIYQLTDAGNQTDEPSMILKEAKTGATLVLGLEKLLQRIHATGGDNTDIKTYLEKSRAGHDLSLTELGNFVRGLKMIRYNEEELFAFGENDPSKDRYEDFINRKDN